MLIEKGHTINVLDHGFVRYVDHLGSDTRIAEAARVSYGQGSKGPEADKKLVTYLHKMRHTSPFEQCNITFEIQMPIFVMRQFVRHRTFRLNEISGRYAQLPDLFYVPAQWRRQSKTNRQGGDEPFTDRENESLSATLSEACKGAYQIYEAMLGLGVSNELARLVLPLNIYTRIYVSCDLHNLMHFLRLRTDAHAQWEIQEFARAMQMIATVLFPWSMEAFKSYTWTLSENSL
jgi:thymidylate synthase (FAD)